MTPGDPAGGAGLPAAGPGGSITPELQRFITAMPKAEIHVHHVGSVSPEAVAALARRHPGVGVPTDPDDVRAFFRFTDFAHFAEVFGAVSSLVTDAEDVLELTMGVATAMAAQQIHYAEVICTPYLSLQRGIPAQAYLQALTQARRRAAAELDLRLNWIFDIPGQHGDPAAQATVDLALQHQPDGLLGLGLGGPEIGVSRRAFAPYFDAARAAGLHSVAHAGETTGPQTIIDALDHLHAERIGHGTSCVREPALLRRLAAEQIPLEVCPTSNLATGAVPSLTPLPAMVSAGLLVSINSDDPPMFGTDLITEYQVAASLLGLDADGVAALAANTIEASFAPEQTKQDLRKRLAGYCARTAG